MMDNSFSFEAIVATIQNLKTEKQSHHYKFINIDTTDEESDEIDENSSEVSPTHIRQM